MDTGLIVSDMAVRLLWCHIKALKTVVYKMPQMGNGMPLRQFGNFSLL